MSELPAQSTPVSPPSPPPTPGAGMAGGRDRAAERLVSSASTSTKIKRLLWSMVQSTLFRCSFHTMNGWRCFLLRMFGAKVGAKCIIRRTVRVYYPWQLEIGDMVVIGDAANIYCLGKITIGNGAMISQEAYLCAGTHDYTDPALPLVTLPITIGGEAWVCARAFISPGVTIGDGAIVAACGVAVKDVPPWNIVGGNPAKFLKKRELKDRKSL